MPTAPGPNTVNRIGADAPRAAQYLQQIPPNTGRGNIASATPDVKATDVAIVLLTLGLLIVSGIQAVIFYRQAKLMGRTLRVTAKATVAASRSTRAAARATQVAETSLYTVERAWMFCAPKSDPPYIPVINPNKFARGVPVFPEITPPTVVFQWRNVGRSPGIMMGAKYRLLFAQKLPRTPKYVDEPKRGEQVVPAASEAVTEDWNMAAPSSQEDLMKIETGAYKLFFFGELVYEDVHAKKHTT